jgi:hypothetical protein
VEESRVRGYDQSQIIDNLYNIMLYMNFQLRNS